MTARVSAKHTAHVLFRDACMTFHPVIDPLVTFYLVPQPAPALAKVVVK